MKSLLISIFRGRSFRAWTEIHRKRSRRISQQHTSASHSNAKGSSGIIVTFGSFISSFESNQKRVASHSSLVQWVSTFVIVLFDRLVIESDAEPRVPDRLLCTGVFMFMPTLIIYADSAELGFFVFLGTY